MRLTIKTKLIGGFLVVVAMLLVVFGVAYDGLTSMGNAADDLADSASLDDAVMSMTIERTGDLGRHFRRRVKTARDSHRQMPVLSDFGQQQAIT